MHEPSREQKGGGVRFAGVAERLGRRPGQAEAAVLPIRGVMKPATHVGLRTKPGRLRWTPLHGHPGDS